MFESKDNLHDRIIDLSDIELSKMVFEDYSNFREEALKIAKSELIRRGIDKENYRNLPAEEQGPKELSIGWLKFYVYIIIPYGVVNSFYQAFNQAHWFNFLIVGVSLIVSLLTIIGMHKWKLWGWNLNVVLLIISAFAMPILRARNTSNYLSISITIFLVWCLPNFVYLGKRKKLFKS